MVTATANPMNLFCYFSCGEVAGTWFRQDRSHDIPFVFQLLRGKVAIWLFCCCDEPFFNTDAPSAKCVCCRRLIWPGPAAAGQWPARNVMEVNPSQKRATTLISRPTVPPVPGPCAWFRTWPSWMWWRPQLKLAHSRPLQSMGDRETSGPAPSRGNVAKQTAEVESDV